MHAYMQELLVPLFKGLLIHIICVLPGHMQLTVTKIPSKKLYVLVNLKLIQYTLSFYTPPWTLCIYTL